MPLWSLHLTSGLEWQWSCSQVKCLWENSGTSWHGECWLTLHVPHKIHLLQLWPWMWWYQKMGVWEMIDVFLSIQFSLSHVWLFVALWTAARQASLSITKSWSLVKLMSTELVMLFNHLILCSSLLLLPSIFPSIRVFSNEFFTSGGQSIETSASASFLPMNNQEWFLLELTGLISLQSKGLSRLFSNTTVQKHQFFGTQLSLWSNSHTYTWLLEKP